MKKDLWQSHLPARSTKHLMTTTQGKTASWDRKTLFGKDDKERTIPTQILSATENMAEKSQSFLP